MLGLKLYHVSKSPTWSYFIQWCRIIGEHAGGTIEISNHGTANKNNIAYIGYTSIRRGEMCILWWNVSDVYGNGPYILN